MANAALDNSNNSNNSSKAITADSSGNDSVGHFIDTEHIELRKMEIRIGTRGSQLALWQSNWVANQLTNLGAHVELVEIKTQGDVTGGPLKNAGGIGLFTKEIQRALLDNRCDLAVHSLKDLPTAPIDGLTIAAVPPRESPYDCLICDTASSISELPDGAVVGTGSPRRVAQIRYLNPKIDIRDIRGNLDTRIRQLQEKKYDAIILAKAGIHRLGLSDIPAHVIPTNHMLPAVGQGALGLETRSGDASTTRFVAQLNDRQSWDCVQLERMILRELNAGCLSPVGTLATINNGNIEINVRVLSPDGQKIVSTRQTGASNDWQAIGRASLADLNAQNVSALI